MSSQNILVFRIGHLGDTVIALPAFWALRTQFPSARITLLTNNDNRNPNYISPIDVLPRTGLIDDSIAYPTNVGNLAKLSAFAGLRRKLISGKFEFVIYLMPRIRNGRQIGRDLSFFKMCGIDRVLGAEFIRHNALLADIPKPTPTVEHEGDFLLDLLTSEGIMVDKRNPRTDLLLTDDEKTKAANWLGENAGRERAARRLIGIAPGSKWSSKVWPEDRFASVVSSLIRDFNCFPVVFGGPEDAGAASRLITKWGYGVNAAGKLAVRESAALLAHCELYLGNDTGTMHLAAAVGTPCVAIFAAIDWIGRWTPVGADSVIFRKRVVCEGCLTPDCFNANECLNLVNEQEVFEACVRMLAKNRKTSEQ